MATAYTSLLGLALPVQGELQGTWGDTVNNSITSLLDTAVAGTTTLSTDADVTLTTTTGASNQARQAIILWTANGTVTRNITAPAQSKIYTVINKTGSTQSIVLRGVGPTTGVTIPAGASGTFAWNGADFVDVSNYINGNKIINGNLTVNGTTTLKGNTTIGDATADTLTVTSTITSNLIFTDNTYDIGASGATRPRNLYLAGNEVIGGSVTWSGGTANGIAYLNASKVATTGAELTYSSGIVQVNTATPYLKLLGTSSTSLFGDAGALVTGSGASDSAIRWDGGSLWFSYGSTYIAKVTSAGYWLFNTNTQIVQDASEVPVLQVFGNHPTNGRGIANTHGSANALGPAFWLNKTRGTTAGSYTITQDGDNLGTLVFSGANGTGFKQGAKIMSQVVGTPTATSMAANLTFWTTPSGSVDPLQRLTIDRTGYVGVNNSSPAYELDVTGTMRISQAAANTFIRFNDTTYSKTAYFNFTNNDLQFWVNGPTKILTVNGNGIDVTNDAAPTGTGVAMGSYSTGSYKWIQSFNSQPLHINRLGNAVYFNVDTLNGVGIGTTTLNGYALASYSSGGDNTLQLRSGNNAALMSLSSGGAGGREYQVYSSGGGNLIGQGYFVIGDATAGATRLAINSAGQVAINNATITSGNILIAAGGCIEAPGFQTPAGNITGYGGFAANRFLIQQENNNTCRAYFMGSNTSSYGAGYFYVSYSNGSPSLELTISKGAVAVAGALSKGSGSFKIDHPLPQLEATHHLVHSFIEGPQADLIYRGVVNLVNGKASVNIDSASGMTEGTFEVLCREVQCFTSNESDWIHVRGSVSGNILTIEAQDNTSTSKISWMVVGERKDKHMMGTDWTDDQGKVIVEPLKPAELPPVMVGTQP